MKIALYLLFLLSSIPIFTFAYFDETDSIFAETDYQSDEWWAPSRKASIYSQKYKSALKMASKMEEDDPYRLPDDVVPFDYFIQLTPIIEPGNFTTFGYVAIEVNCTRDTHSIVLNAADLTPYAVQVQDLDSLDYLRIGEIVDEQEEKERITIPISPPGLEAGKNYKISMKFVSKLNDELRGLYRSSYEENGATKYLAVTQFEATDARRAFPCFDEPNLKATFSITISRKSTLTSVSNMPRERLINTDSEFPGHSLDIYRTSVKMPTYLVALMVSEFVRTKSDESLSPGVDFGIISRPGYENQTGYAADVGPRILNFYSEEYFGIDYPLPKQDMAAIPDFAAGAMENWGLITYREADLLIDELRASAAARQRVALIIAHELAHQWFGNLVTMNWWNVLWLNEGFATYMEGVGTDYVEPTFSLGEQFVVNDLQYVLGIDSLESSRPINFEVNTPSQINQMFDAISYEKGGSILRMCAHLIGLDTFRRGVSRYLEANEYGNTVPDDLWSALQSQVLVDRVNIPFPIKTIMGSWTNKMGYPLITVNRNYANGRATITQKRFLLRSSGNSDDTTVYRWFVPITYSGNFMEEPKLDWLTEGSDRNVISNLGVTSSQWVIFNAEQVGYYRVLYDDPNLTLIIQQLLKENHVIPASNRAQLIDDYLNSARAGETSYVNALELTKVLALERDYIPWRAASTALDYLDVMLYGQTDYNDWKDYMTGLIVSLYNDIGFNPTSLDRHLKIYLRSIAINWACTRLFVPDCVVRAKTSFNAWLSDEANNNVIDPNLRQLVSCTAVATSIGSIEYSFVFRKYRETVLGNEKIEYLTSMACSRNPFQLRNLLNSTIAQNSPIRLQDANRLFGLIANNPVGHEIAMDWLSDLWDDIDAYFSGFAGFGGSGALPGFFRALCNRVNTPAKLSKLNSILDAHLDVLGPIRSVQQGMELARANVLWNLENYVEITDWLKDQKVEETTMEVTTAPSTGPSTAPTTVPTRASTPIIVHTISTNHPTIRLTTSSTTATTTLAPPKSCSCSQMDSYGYHWEAKSITNTVRITEECSKMVPRSKGNASWTCDYDSGICNNGKFSTIQPDYSKCSSAELDEIINSVNEENVTEIWIAVTEFTSRENVPYYGHEILNILDLITTLLDRQQNEMNETVGIDQLVLQIDSSYYGTDTTNNLISNDAQWAQIDNGNEGILKLLDVSNDIAFRLSNVSKLAGIPLLCEISFDNISVSSSYWNGIQGESVVGCDLKTELQLESFLRFPSNKICGQMGNVTSYILLPKEINLKTFKAVGVFIPASNLIKQFLPRNNNSKLVERKEVNSPFISYTLYEPEANEASKLKSFSFDNSYVKLVFEHAWDAKYPPVRTIRRNLMDGEEPSAVIGSSICAYLYFNETDLSSGNHGRYDDDSFWTWDDEGCYVASTNRTHTVCHCNHLTGFANLMDFHEYKYSKALDITSLVCSILSITCLAFTFFILTCVRSLKMTRTFLTKNLCVALLISHLLILITLDKGYIYDELICAIMGMVLHYFLLVSFMWMLIEGYQLYRIVNHVFDVLTTKLTIFYVTVAYIVPAISVIATVLTATFLEDDFRKAYAGDETCWLVGDWTWAFNGPVAAVILANLFFVVVGVRSFCNVGNSPDAKASPRFRKPIIRVVTLTLFLGLTWITGFLLLSDLIVWAFVFTIFNGLQGVFIFTDRCILNIKIRNAQKDSLKSFHETMAAKWHRLVSEKKITKKCSENGLATNNNFDVNNWNWFKSSVKSLKLRGNPVSEIRRNSDEDPWWEETNSDFSQELPMGTNAFAARGIFDLVEGGSFTSVTETLSVFSVTTYDSYA